MSKSKFLRLLNADAGLVEVTLCDPVANIQVGTVQLLGNSEFCLEKDWADTLSANVENAVYAVRCARFYKKMEPFHAENGSEKVLHNFIP
jgi:hypothetical protein